MTRPLNYIFFVLMMINTAIWSCHDTSDPLPEDTTQSQSIDPATIYQERCVACHGVDGRLGFGGAKDLTKSKLTLDQIIRQVTYGKGAMAPYANILSTSEIQAVSSYALKLQKDSL